MRVARIKGHSLEPVLSDGEFVVFRRKNGAKRGEIVLANHPELGWVAKKVHAVGKGGAIALHGLSELTPDGKRPGSVPPDRLFGKRLFKIPLVRWRSSEASLRAADSIDCAE